MYLFFTCVVSQIKLDWIGLDWKSWYYVAIRFCYDILLHQALQQFTHNTQEGNEWKIGHVPLFLTNRGGLRASVDPVYSFWQFVGCPCWRSSQVSDDWRSARRCTVCVGARFIDVQRPTFPLCLLQPTSTRPVLVFHLDFNTCWLWRMQTLVRREKMWLCRLLTTIFETRV